MRRHAGDLATFALAALCVVALLLLTAHMPESADLDPHDDRSPVTARHP